MVEVPNSGLILIRDDKGFSGNVELSSFLAKKETILLTPDPSGEFHVSSHESQDGTSILIDAKTLDVTLSSGIGNIYPVVYYYKDNLLILARTIDSIVTYLRLLKRDVPNLNMNWVGIISSLLFDYPISDHTYYENIRKSEMGTQLVFSTDKRIIKKYVLWRPIFEREEYKSLSYDSLEKQAREILFSLKDHIPKEPCVIPLTGGYDSRLLACLYREIYKGEAISLTFQRGSSYETFCAKSIAEKLKIDHIVAELDKECYDSFANKIVRDTSGLLTPMHVHGIYSCQKYLRLEQQKYNRIFGYFGDPNTGDMTENHASQEIIRSPEALLKHYLKNSIFRNNLEYVYELLLPEIQEIFNEFVQFNPDLGYFHEYWKITQRQNNLVTHIFDYHRKACSVYEPYANKDFCDFFLGLPQEYRQERMLFIEAACKIWPEIFSLPSTHFTTGVSGKMMTFIKRASNLLQYSLETVFRNKQIFKSPFIYEQHNSLLRNDLAIKMKSAYLILRQDILSDLDLPKNYLMPIRGGNTAEAFRILTLSALYSKDC
jgi:hypothetical protein